MSLASTVYISLSTLFWFVMFFSSKHPQEQLVKFRGKYSNANLQTKIFHFLPTSQLENSTNHMLVNNPTLVTNYLHYSHNWLPNRGNLRFTLPYNFSGYSPKRWRRHGSRWWNRWSHYVHSQKTDRGEFYCATHFLFLTVLFSSQP